MFLCVGVGRVRQDPPYTSPCAYRSLSSPSTSFTTAPPQSCPSPPFYPTPTTSITANPLPAASYRLPGGQSSARCGQRSMPNWLHVPCASTSTVCWGSQSSCSSSHRLSQISIRPSELWYIMSFNYPIQATCIPHSSLPPGTHIFTDWRK
jgi:hypothetical protein